MTRGQIDLCQQTGDEWKAADGKRSLDLHGSPGFGGVKQTIPTKAGQKYRVTFQMTTNLNQADERVKMAVRAAGADKEFELASAGRTHANPQWEKLTWEFTAKGDKTELEFHTAMPPTAFPFGGPMLMTSVVAIDRPIPRRGCARRGVSPPKGGPERRRPGGRGPAVPGRSPPPERFDLLPGRRVPPAPLRIHRFGLGPGRLGVFF